MYSINFSLILKRQRAGNKIVGILSPAKTVKGLTERSAYSLQVLRFFIFMQYYPIVRKWKKIKPFTETKELQDILVRDFNLYTMGRWGTPFTHGMLPEEIESCDWRFEVRGKHPEYWKFIKHGACHWVVNFCLCLAQKIEPKKQWRIVTSELHSTVWDGEETIFDINFLGMGISIDETVEMAFKKNKILPVGKELRIWLAPSSIKKS